MDPLVGFRARISLLPTERGGKTRRIFSGYRPSITFVNEMVSGTISRRVAGRSYRCLQISPFTNLHVWIQERCQELFKLPEVVWSLDPVYA